MLNSPSKPKNLNLKGYYAGVISRLLAFIIDILIVNIVLLFIGWLVSTSLGFIQNLSSLGIDVMSLNYFTKIITIISDPFFISAFVLIIIYIYFIFFVIFSGHTPGKAILGLRIVTTEGKKISFTRSTIRFLAYIPTLLSFGIGFFWLILDDQRQTWHDTLSGTFVVYTWEAQPDEKFLKGIFADFHDQPSQDFITDT
jgi:uncharacterized RDD family membrane protein YckC